MREEIRELQEQRAAAMMTEIVELEKERDLALGKVKRLEKKVKGKPSHDQLLTSYIRSASLDRLASLTVYTYESES